MPSLDRGRDSGRFDESYDRIRRYLRGMVRDAQEADDLTQEAFLRAHRERDTVKDPGAWLAWLYRIATHVALDRLRQRAGAAARLADVEPAQLEAVEGDAPSLDQVLEQGQMSACVQRFVVELPDTYRAVLLLHDVHGLTGPEVAATLGLSLPTVKIRLLRARRRLATALTAGCTFSCDHRGVLVCEPKP